MKIRGLVGITVATVLLCGCGDDPKVDAAATAVEESAGRCLVTVRDKHTRYRETPDCVALSTLADQYIRLTLNTKPSARVELKFTEAQREAWTALAMSETCSREPMKIW
jgi:hypothetical protein